MSKNIIAIKGKALEYFKKDQWLTGSIIMGVFISVSIIYFIIDILARAISGKSN